MGELCPVWERKKEGKKTAAEKKKGVGSTVDDFRWGAKMAEVSTSRGKGFQTKLGGRISSNVDKDRPEGLTNKTRNCGHKFGWGYCLQ